MSGRGQIRDRGPNRWLVRASLGRDPKTGKRRYHNKTIHGTKKDAQRYLTKVLREIDHGTYVHQSSKTVGEYLEEWLDTVAQPRVSERTLNDYRRNLDSYIVPALGQRRLQDLTPFDVQQVYSGMLGRGLSPNTVKAAHAPLRSALNNAVKWRLIPNNPATLVDLPKKSRKERPVWTAEQAKVFVEHAAQDKHSPLWILLLTTGLRPGEALALKWSDLDGYRLRIRRSLTRTKSGAWTFEEPKTPKSRRTVTVPASVLEALARYKVNQARARLKAGPAFADHGLIFCRTTGAPLDINNVRRRHFYKILERAALPRIRMYDLRHTHATLLLAQNSHPKIVSERLGHSSVMLTMDTYSHVLPTMQDGPAELMETLLFGGT